MNTDIFRDISLLYELSLSVGGSLILRDNCDQFLSVLMSRKNLDYCSVWLRNDQFPGFDGDQQYRAIYSNPEIKLHQKLLPEDTIAFRQFREREIYTVCPEDENWDEHVVERNITGGAFAYYRLGDLGFLKIYSSMQEGPFDYTELNKLSNIIQKFTISIQACLQHQQSMYNAELKIQAERSAIESSAKLSKTVAMLSHLTQHMQDAIMVEDENRRIVSINERFVDYFDLGLRPADVVGLECGMICDGVKKSFDDPEHFTSSVGQIIKARENRVGEELYLSDGRVVERDFIPIYIDDVYSGHLWQYHDVTQRKNMLSDLRNSKVAAETANESKSRFLANMSHEIRTPLNAIIGMSKLLSDSPMNMEQESYNDAILKSSENLLVIINEILDFSKIEAGKLNLEKVGFNIVEVFKNNLTTMQFKAEEKSLRLTSFFDEDIPEVLIGDPVRMSQILMNLLSNALKFTTNGFVHVDCRLFSANHDNKSVLRINVEDSGIGIDEDKIDLIFDNFNQENTSTTRVYGGTGLGLSIVKQLVNLMDGEIEVFSRKGRGTNFTLTIPFEIGDSSDVQVKTAKMIDPRVLRNKHVLLVDDHSINRFLVVSLFKNWNIPITEAVNGQDAVDKLKKEHFDLVLMDKQMPVMDGLEATRHIRQELELDIPIVALSANAMKDVIQRCLDAGMNDFLPKPFEPSELLEKMVKLMDVDLSDVNYVEEEPQKMTEPKRKRYDIYALGEMVNNDKSELKKLIDMFLDTTPDMLTEIEDQYTKANYERIGKLVHKMKPSVTLMRMGELTPLVPLIEDYENTPVDQLNRSIEKYLRSMKEIVSMIEKEPVG